jgi:hypothetical protein
VAFCTLGILTSVSVLISVSAYQEDIIEDFEFKNVAATAASIMEQFDADGSGKLDRQEMGKVGVILSLAASVRACV